MRQENFLRTIFFSIFFSAGIVTFVGVLLCDEFFRYYQKKQVLSVKEERIRQLENLIVDYDILLERFKKDPNIVRRVASVTLGMEHKDSNTVYPPVSLNQLAAASRILKQASDEDAVKPEIPAVLVRCTEKYNRFFLLVTGGGLILISFIFFGPTSFRKKGKPKTT